MPGFVDDDIKKEDDEWDGILKPKRPESRPTADHIIRRQHPKSQAVFNIDEGGYDQCAPALREKLAIISNDINENNRFTFEKLKWSIHESDYNNFLLRNILTEHLSHKFNINLCTDDVVCFILYWIEKNEAISLTNKAIQSYATENKSTYLALSDNNSKENKFYANVAPELIIYTGTGEKYNVKMPYLSWEKFYTTLKISDEPSLFVKGEETISAPAVPEVTAEQQEKENDEFIDTDVVNSEEESDVADLIIRPRYCKYIYYCLQEYYERGAIKADSSVTQIEVPFDKYKDVLKSMDDAIAKGAISAVNVPKKAESLIRKGHFSYSQVKNIAKGGTVEGISFDAENEMVIADLTMGVSVALSFAVSIWSGESEEQALKKAARCGIKVSGMDFVSTVLSAQLPREAIVGLSGGCGAVAAPYLGLKVADGLANVYKNGIHSCGKEANIASSDSLYSVDMDVTKILQTRILGNQGRINLIKTFSIQDDVDSAPGKHTSFWGKIKNVVAGKFEHIFTKKSKVDTASDEITRYPTEDSVDFILKFIAKRFVIIGEDFLMNPKEAASVIDELCIVLSDLTLLDIYMSDNRLMLTDSLIRPIIKTAISRRNKITPPTLDQLCYGLLGVLEEIFGG